MTDRSLLRLADYIKIIADHMGLKDWTIDLSDDDPDDGLDGACVRTFGRKRAQIKLHHSWPEWPPERLRQTIVHELLHCHMDPAVKDPMNMVAELIPPTTHDVLNHFAITMLEYAVDGIATEWADTMPLFSVETR